MIYGINPVLEALRAGRVRRLRVGARADRRVDEALALARARAWRSSAWMRRRSIAIARGGVHQGIVAELEAPRDYSVEELVAAAAPEAPLLVVLDGIEDPHNIGAILRTVDAAGAHGVVRQARHAAPLDGVAAKASAGAAAVVRIATVVNIARALEELKEAGVWTVGLAGDAAERLRRRSTSRCRRRSSSGRKGRACGGWSGSAAIGWCPSRCAGRSKPECVGGGRGGAVRGRHSGRRRELRSEAAERIEVDGSRRRSRRSLAPVAWPCATNTLLSGLA